MNCQDKKRASQNTFPHCSERGVLALASERASSRLPPIFTTRQRFPFCLSRHDQDVAELWLCDRHFQPSFSSPATDNPLNHESIPHIPHPHLINSESSVEISSASLFLDVLAAPLHTAIVVFYCKLHAVDVNYSNSGLEGHRGSHPASCPVYTLKDPHLQTRARLHDQQQDRRFLLSPGPASCCLYCT